MATAKWNALPATRTCGAFVKWAVPSGSARAATTTAVSWKRQCFA